MATLQRALRSEALNAYQDSLRKLKMDHSLSKRLKLKRTNRHYILTLLKSQKTITLNGENLALMLR